MRGILSKVYGFQQLGLIVVIGVLALLVGAFAGTHPDKEGLPVHNFFNPGTIGQIALFASAFAIMAVGVTMVIITGGIDLSVGSTYALAGVGTVMILRALHLDGSNALFVGFALCVGIGLLCGLLNGALITTLGVHPFIITLGMMWVFRGIAFVISKGQSYNMPEYIINTMNNRLGLTVDVFPVPIIVMLIVSIIGWLFLTRTVAGRRIFAVGGNLEASRYSGVSINKVLLTVYAVSGLTAGVAAFVMAGFFGSASSNDGNGYELFVIASTVVGGASLAGGKGSAISAMLGALLIQMLRQSITTLHFDQQYEFIIIGCAIIIAVVLDRVSARISARRLMRMRD